MSCQVGRPCKAGERRAYALLVISDTDLALSDLRRRDREGRGEEHVHAFQDAVELSCGEHPTPSRVRVAVRLRTLTLHQALTDLFAEALCLVFEAVLVDGVCLSGKDEPLRVQRVPQVGDLDLPYLHAERP